MDVDQLKSCSWFAGLMELVQQALDNINEHQLQTSPQLELELKGLEERLQGWSQSLGNPKLNLRLREDIETKWASANARYEEVNAILAGQKAQGAHLRTIVSPEQVVERLNRLADVLARNNPTRGNLELSLHIDRIECFKDGRVAMRTCKLGALAGVAEYVRKDVPDKTSANGNTNVRPRRRTQRQLDGTWDQEQENNALAHFAADPNRFAGLDEQWFWIDGFRVPDPAPSWVVENAEAVFRRRQESQLSFGKLAREFGRTRPTIIAAVRHYEATHPGETDTVNLKCGGQRPKRFDLPSIAEEAKQLWENGWSKERLAEKYGCSAPTIDKALGIAYERAGVEMPTRDSIRQAKIAEARRLHDGGKPLKDVARAMNVSDVTARRYLQESYAAEGKQLPDQRRKKP